MAKAKKVFSIADAKMDSGLEGQLFSGGYWGIEYLATGEGVERTLKEEKASLKESLKRLVLEAGIIHWLMLTQCSRPNAILLNGVFKRDIEDTNGEIGKGILRWK
jgi:hypothetical protein